MSIISLHYEHEHLRIKNSFQSAGRLRRYDPVSNQFIKMRDRSRKGNKWKIKDFILYYKPRQTSMQVMYLSTPEEKYLFKFLDKKDIEPFLEFIREFLFVQNHENLNTALDFYENL